MAIMTHQLRCAVIQIGHFATLQRENSSEERPGFFLNSSSHRALFLQSCKRFIQPAMAPPGSRVWVMPSYGKTCRQPVPYWVSSTFFRVRLFVCADCWWTTTCCPDRILFFHFFLQHTVSGRRILRTVPKRPLLLLPLPKSVAVRNSPHRKRKRTMESLSFALYAYCVRPDIASRAAVRRTFSFLEYIM